MRRGRWASSIRWCVFVNVGMKPKQSDLATIASVAQGLGVVLTVVALFFARDVFIPLALGLLLSFLLSPVVNRLQRVGVPNVLAVVMTATLTFLFLASLFTLLGHEISNLVRDLPNYKTELIEKARGVAGLTTGVGGSLDELATEMTEAIEDPNAVSDQKKEELSEGPPPQSLWRSWSQKMFSDQSDADLVPNDGTTAKRAIYTKRVEEELPLATWATTAGTVLGPLATAGLVTVFALFMLIHRENLRDRLIAVISHGDYVTTTEALDEAAQRITRYLVAQTMINTGYGILLAIGLAFIGVTMSDTGTFPNAILWGVLATCLRFIPYLGPTAAAVFPSVIALTVFPGYSVFFAVVILITVMELTCNNVIEPWLYGTSTGISAVAVIIAAVFWGWLWGPVGLLLSTPLTVCLVVLGRYVPRFKVLATLLGEDVAIKPSLRFYQRLLAGDEHRAVEILTGYADEHDFDKACDQVIIPTLKRIRLDRESETLDDADLHRLFALAGGCIAKLRKHMTPADEAESAETTDLPLVVGCVSHHFSEALVMNLLRISGNETYRIDTIDEETIPAETGRLILGEAPVAVVIVVLPSGGFAQARYLCQTIRDEGYTGPVLMACLGRFKSFDKLFVKFRRAGATSMTTSFSQTRSKIDSIIRSS